VLGTGETLQALEVKQLPTAAPKQDSVAPSTSPRRLRGKGKSRMDYATMAALADLQYAFSTGEPAVSL
jgi:hypothetical protein